MIGVQPLLENRDWLAAIALLSLDLTRPFYGLMGVPIPNVQVFQDLLRQAVQRFPLGFVLFEPREPDLAAIDLVRQGVSSLSSPDHALALEVWIKTIFSPQDPRWYHYRRTLMRCEKQWREGAEDILELASYPEVVHAINKFRNRKELEITLSTAKRTVRSSWDLFMYNLGLYIDGPDIARQINNLLDAVRIRDPLQTVTETTDTNQFQQLWEVLLKSMRAEILDVLWRKAQQGIPTLLPHPMEYRRKL